MSEHEYLVANLVENVVPEGLADVTAGNYREFLVERRRLMASRIRDYYQAL